MPENVKHIFIAEDETDLHYSLSLMLEMEGYKISSAYDGLEAVNSIKSLDAESSPVDLLITDIQLPGLSGVELIDELRRQGFNIPTMAITGYGYKEVVIELLQRGCIEYFDKPFKPEKLLEYVNNFFVKNERVENINKYAVKLTNQVDAYKNSYEELKEQLDSAVSTYQNLAFSHDKEYKALYSSKYQPVTGVGGDFAILGDTEKGCDLLLVDVAGHDIGASYYTILIKSIFEEHHLTAESGDEFLKSLNSKIIDHAEARRLVTAVFMKLDLEEMTGTITIAGHPPVGFIKPDVPFVQELKGESDVLGMHDNPEFKTFDISFLPGDRFVLYTDGVSNVYNDSQCNEERNVLGDSEIQKYIEKYKELPLEEMVEEIWKEVMLYCKYNVKDDVLLFALEIPGRG